MPWTCVYFKSTFASLGSMFISLPAHITHHYTHHSSMHHTNKHGIAWHKWHLITPYTRHSNMYHRTQHHTTPPCHSSTPIFHTCHEESKGTQGIPRPFHVLHLQLDEVDRSAIRWHRAVSLCLPSLGGSCGLPGAGIIFRAGGCTRPFSTRSTPVFTWTEMTEITEIWRSE